MTRKRAKKQFRVSRRMLFTWFALASLILFIAPSSLTNNFQFAFLRTFHWPLSIGENISLSVRTRSSITGPDAVPRADYHRLQNYCASLEAQLKQEHEKLEHLAGLRARFPLEGANLVAAYVFPGSFDKANGRLIINQGRDDYLAQGQFVLADNGIIGIITDVSSHEANVRLITCPNSNIPVQIAGSKRFMTGSGDNFAKIPMLKTRLEPGTEIMAEKKAGLLNAPMIIARVVRCERNPESAVLWDIIVRPVTEFEHLDDVAVIVMNQPK